MKKNLITGDASVAPPGKKKKIDSLRQQDMQQGSRGTEMQIGKNVAEEKGGGVPATEPRQIQATVWGNMKRRKREDGEKEKLDEGMR